MSAVMPGNTISTLL